MISPLSIMRGSILSYEGKPQIVKSIGEYIMFEGKKEWIGPSLVNGEPLSEEWLFKFGFYANSSAWFERKGFLFLWGYTEEFGHFLHFADSDQTIVGSAMKYVHQLQMLCFSLTGEHLNVPKIK